MAETNASAADQGGMKKTLSNSDALTSLENELDQGMRYINLMQARYGDGRLKLSVEMCIRDSSTSAVGCSAATSCGKRKTTSQPIAT